MKAQFITAEEVQDVLVAVVGKDMVYMLSASYVLYYFQDVLGVSRSKAYQIVQGMNRELKAQGFITISGKCPIAYFRKKFYGLEFDQNDRITPTPCSA